MKFLVFSLLLLTGCANYHQQLADASAVKALSESATVLPDLPPECYQDVPHAARVIGQDAPVVARREYQQTSKANASKRRCVAVYTDLQQAHAQPKE